MIVSMTGYGKSVLQLPTKKITVEVKSLNSKQLDLFTRIPSFYKSKEIAMRKYIADKAVRGKVEASIYVEMTGEETDHTVNAAVVKQYMGQLAEIVPGKDPVEYLQLAMRMPDTMKTEREELDESEWNEVMKALEEAVAHLHEFRADEGAVLAEDFRKRIETIRSLKSQTESFEEVRVETVKARIYKALSELKEKVDENRFEQEMIYYLEKYDITEEKIRLDSHLNYFLTELESNKSNGKKLGFIAQEMGREINTMGSKSNHAEMQKLVVKMKDELEKIKEQVLNVL